MPRPRIARRIDELSVRSAVGRRVRCARRPTQLVRRLDAVQHEVAAKHGIADRGRGHLARARRAALRFIAREGWLLLIGGPIALWGRINHWLPFRAARADRDAIRRERRGSGDANAWSPARRSSCSPIWRRPLAVAAVWGPMVAAGYLVSLPIAADINFYLSERLSRAAVERARLPPLPPRPGAAAAARR